MKPPVTDTVKICPACEEDIVEIGKSICPGCELVQATLAMFPPDRQQAAIVVIPFDAVQCWKYISGALVLCALAAWFISLVVR